jgi:trk system potassium uptake protein TrkH
MHLLRAESPGPQVGKIVSKMKVTTRILYLIYLGMTALQIIIMCCGTITDYSAMCNDLGVEAATAYQNDKVFHAFLSTFGCAGTGGFGFMPGSMEYFTPFAQYVVSIFLILFGVNFSLYYLLLIGKIKDVLRSEEFKSYFMIIGAAVGFVFLSLVGRFEAFPQVYTTEESFRHSLFQVSSLMTTAGYTTTDYDV